MKRQTVGLCLIAKNEEGHIGKAIASVIEYVDVVYLTDTGSTDKTIEEAKAVAARYHKPIEVSNFEWIDDYAAARNFNFSQAKTDWIFWIDCDDTVENPASLPAVIEKASALDYTGLLFWYRYHVDEKGLDKAGHNKMRLVKNGLYHWTPKAPIHENLFLLDEFADERKESFIDTPVILHHANQEHFIKSGERNLRILSKLLAKEVSDGKKDPRTIFLLGREYHSQWKLNNQSDDRNMSRTFLKEYLELADFGGERMQACNLLCDIYTSIGDYDTVEKYAYEAVKAHPSHPMGYVLVARTYSYRGSWQLVIDWCKRAQQCESSPLDGTIHTPKGIQREVDLLMGEAFVKLDKYDEAKASIEDYLNIADKAEVPELKEHLDYVSAYDQAHKIMRALVVMANTAFTNDKLEVVKSLLETVPESLRNRAEYVKLRRRVGLMKTWAKGTVVIFCGGEFEPWDETNLSKGIGGSETAVIEMAQRFGKAGYKVTVYNSVEERKKFGNVEYVPFNEVDFADEYDIFISWRNPTLSSNFNVAAKKRYLWLHDIPNSIQYNSEVIESYDKIIVLSKYHRKFLPAVPEEKFYYSSNGINVELIKKVEKENIKRNPHKIIYASSPDRGLENLLDCLLKVKEEVPDIEVVWAYGWDTFDALRKDPAALEWKAKMQKRMKELGVIELGRISKKDLIREYFSSGVWAYPTMFGEINCIVAQEAQACGDYAVTTGFAALEEIQQVGVKVPLKDFAAALISALQHPESAPTTADMRNARLEFDWKKTANSWMIDLFYDAEFEQVEPLVSVICITIRPGIFRVLKDTLAKQTYKNFELIVVDGRYEERKDEVTEYMKDVPYSFIHVPDPERDRKKYPYGLFHADNAAINIANGDLFVFLQDFILIPEDGIEKFVSLYKIYPDSLYTGVDTRNATKLVDPTEPASLSRSIDVYCGGEYKIAEEQFKSRRIRVGGAKRESWNPYEWELNWAAAPRSVLIGKLGGFQTEWDRGFAFDNTEIGLRHVYNGGSIIVDETNLCTAISHWDLFGEHDEEGVPDRNKKPNDQRFQNYQEYLSQRGDANVKMKFLKPKYDKLTYERIKLWKKK